MSLDHTAEPHALQVPQKPMEERSRRILEIAVELAEEGGFEAVRQRDVASKAGVALGTLYKRFPSKEGILVAALEVETDKMLQRIAQEPVPGATALERVDGLMRTITQSLCHKPNLAKALIKAVTSGEPELTEKVAAYHARMRELIASALASEDGSASPTELQRQLAYTLQQVWFAAVVGWMGGLHDQATIVERVGQAAGWMLRGTDT